HYMSAFPEISRRARDKNHNLEDDTMVKNIFNLGKHMDGVGMKIPSWMITDEMKLTNHYQIAPRKSTVIRLRIPPRLSERLTPPTLIPTTDEADDLVLQDTLQIEKLVERTKNVVENVKVDSSNLRKNDNPIDLDTRLESRSDKESPEVELTAAKQPVNVNKEEEESGEDDYELKRREKVKHVEESRSTPSPTTNRSTRIHSTLISSDIKKLQELMKTDPKLSSSTPSSSSPKYNITATNQLLSLFKPKTGRFKHYKSFF
ncbi:hypothetical protein Tco_0785328, partial [Tanacetum coccineum]